MDSLLCQVHRSVQRHFHHSPTKFQGCVWCHKTHCDTDSCSSHCAGSWDGTLRLWDLNSGNTTRRFIGHTKDVLSVAFSVDNRQVGSYPLYTIAFLWQSYSCIDVWLKHVHYLQQVRNSFHTHLQQLGKLLGWWSQHA